MKIPPDPLLKRGGPTFSPFRKGEKHNFLLLKREYMYLPPFVKGVGGFYRDLNDASIQQQTQT